MDEQVPAAPARGLVWKGDKDSPRLAGIPAHDLTPDQVKAWLTRAQYDEALASGLYERAAAADKSDNESTK